MLKKDVLLDSYPPTPNRHLYEDADSLTESQQAHHLVAGHILHDAGPCGYVEAWRGRADDYYYWRRDNSGLTVDSGKTRSAVSCVRAFGEVRKAVNNAS